MYFFVNLLYPILFEFFCEISVGYIVLDLKTIDLDLHSKQILGLCFVHKVCDESFRITE